MRLLIVGLAGLFIVVMLGVRAQRPGAAGEWLFFPLVVAIGAVLLTSVELPVTLRRNRIRRVLHFVLMGILVAAVLEGLRALLFPTIPPMLDLTGLVGWTGWALLIAALAVLTALNARTSHRPAKSRR